MAVLSEGDPLFYGSYMHLHVRLASRYPAEVVPGVTAMSGCWSQAGLPIVQGDDVLSVLPGTLDESELVRRLRDTEAAVIMKVGRNLPKIRRALAEAGLINDAFYVERGTMVNTWMTRLVDKPNDEAPYFSIVLVPGSPDQMTPEARQAAGKATELFGYGPYLDRLELRPDQTRVASDNREELDRARAALTRAAQGIDVAVVSGVVSGGDPGVFAMAAAICEAIESGLAEWRQVDLQIVPGVTAMLAVAARIGAPLSHAWRVISSQGQRLVKEGRQLNSAEENLSELASQAKTFADNLLPILRSAQIA